MTVKKFIQSLSYSRSTFIGFGAILLISMLYLLVDANNGKLQIIDFKVYYFAAKNILAGEHLYEGWVDHYHYIFKYSPSSAIFFIPFTIFPFEVAKIIYWLFLTGIIMIGFRLCMLIIEPTIFSNSKKANNIILLATLPLILHITRELHLGQVNHVLLVMYISTLWFILKEKYYTAALLIALSIFIKPFGLIFLPFLFYKKEYKTLFVSVLFIGIIGFLPLLFWRSWDFFKLQNWHWYCELILEMEVKQELIMPENHTIFSVFARYTPIRWIISEGIFTVIYQLTILAAIGFAILYFISKGKKSALNPLIAEFGIVTAIIPLLAFTTANAFGFAQILVFIVLINYQKLNLSGKILAIISFLFIGGACSDIIGKPASFLMDDLSLVSIGTIGLIALTVSLRNKKIV